MRAVTNRWLGGCAAVLGVALLASVGCCADAPGAMEGATLLNSAPDTAQYLGSPYKAEAKGFNFSPPWGATIAEKAMSKNLIEFQVDSKQWVGDVKRINLGGKVTLDDYAKSATDDLRGKVPALQILEQKPTKLGDRPALRLTVSMLGDASPTTVARSGRGGAPGPAEKASFLSQWLIVQMDPGQFFLLEMYSPLRDRDEATRAFDAMAGAFEVYDPETLKIKHGEAVLLGKKWLESLAAEQMKPKLNNQVQIFRMISGKDDVGYVTFEESEANQIARQGVQIVTHSKSFLPNGGLLMGDNMAFWAYSHDEKGEALAHYSMWENINKVDTNLVIKGKVTPNENWTEEIGALDVESKSQITPEERAQLDEQRRVMIAKDPSRPPPPEIEAGAPQYRIHISLSGDAKQKFFQNLAEAHDNALDVMVPDNVPAPLPKFLDYTWTRMVDLTKPSEMSFWSFNSNAQRLALRTLIVTGKTERIQINGQTKECWKCIDELDPGNTVILVDNDGRIMSMRSSDGTVFLPTTELEMQRRWAARLGK